MRHRHRHHNIDAVSPAVAIEALDAYARTLGERGDGWRALEVFLRDVEKCPPHCWALTRRAGAPLIEGELRWVSEFRTELAALR